MTYRFELQDASLTEALRRIVRQEIAPVLDHLQEDNLAPPVVHDIRKRVKKLRGLLRLVRHGMRDVQAAENVILRDAAQALSGSRDAAVRLATFDRLMAGDSAPAVLALRAHLVAEAAMPAPPPPDLRQVFADLSHRAATWDLHGSDRRILADGLADTRARARAAMRTARESGSDEALHDWRKRAKDHWYQARLFTAVWPEVMRPIIAEADRLGEALGDHHDLAVLVDHLQALPDDVARPEARQAVTALARDAQQAIEATTFPLGARLFAGDPEEMADLWLKWWKIWRAQLG